MSKRKSDQLEDDDSCSTSQRPRQVRKMGSAPVTTNIELSSQEARLKKLLLDVAEYIDRSQPSSAEPIVLRWAGGWVRDKLLGIGSHDIDTAINTMTGEAFSSKIVELCKQPETVEKHALSDTDIGNLHKIAANPDKSKHLETTTIKLLGFDVDFVNLRKETYTQDSRNPQVEFGTAEEDALRRDATINALFYNLNTGRVEDFTGGLADMDAKLIRTPLEPLQTFTDDPLRVLRLIRFASRLDFVIDPEVEAVMRDERVLSALRNRQKISRERVGVEVEKMFQGNHPRNALKKIHSLGLYHTVFTDPNKPDMPQPNVRNLAVAYDCLESLRQRKTPGSIYDVLVRSDESSYFSWVLAALTPWMSIAQPAHIGPTKPPPPFATLAAREGIKAPNKMCDAITGSYNHREEIMSLKVAVSENAEHVHERDRFGLAIRRWEARGGQWKLQVLSALLHDALQTLQPGDTASRDTAFVAGWQKFLDHLHELDVMEAPSLKRIIDGKQLSKALGARPGIWMTAALDVCVAWQLRNPDITDPTGAIEEVRSKKEELGIPI
ncbi:hypothetical protein PFICI_05227 [Pestalotiopsis fici W106-1]|uniref:Poly A polymerase head domain-containing protein n=1 Tax=Pestalotiopsis fici (strain W106-1 / CGMCC3.15140) TaxID=1229662 RepID=W3XDT4_PESFW|nr:uncharacterized protein PFICI_05227 [Pestalotiopsis fici W106-1]ETS83351.1 hypothetical protein PFICI_05227 [Pestalotiopsis fici W106-1]